ncbi:MAG: histidinol-phosphate transaminase [Nitriliruptoraceae bacterium]
MTADDATPSRVPVRAELDDVVPYGAPQADVAVRLNTNETAEPPPREFLAAAAARIEALDLHRYPDRDHVALRAALARRHNCDVDQVWAANGSNEILLELLQVYGGPGRQAVVFRPSYSMYPELCRTAMTPVIEIDLDDDFAYSADTIDAACAAQPDVIILASPNNPVGTVVDASTVRALHERTAALIVVDEAYIDFAPERSMSPLLETLPRLVLVRTFSKAFRLAGARLGYLVARPWVVDDVQKVRLPYHLSAVTQTIGELALANESSFLAHRAEVAAERDCLASALAQLPDVEVFASAANFLLVRTGRDDVFHELFARGVLVRDFATRPRLTGCIRVTIGTPAENAAFLAAFREILGAPTT